MATKKKTSNEAPKTKSFGGKRYKRARRLPYSLKSEALKRQKKVGATRRTRLQKCAGGYMVWVGVEKKKARNPAPKPLRRRNPGSPARKTKAKRKPQLKRGDQVAFQGRRWFNRTYGNTYHTVTVSVLPKGGTHWITVGTSSVEYGYGQQYEQTGEKILRKRYSMPRGWGKRRQPLWKLRDFGVDFQSTVQDVKRKRDL